MIVAVVKVRKLFDPSSTEFARPGLGVTTMAKFCFPLLFSSTRCRPGTGGTHLRVKDRAGGVFTRSHVVIRFEDRVQFSSVFFL